MSLWDLNEGYITGKQYISRTFDMPIITRVTRAAEVERMRMWMGAGQKQETVSVSPDSKVHGANVGPIWGRQDPSGPYVGPMHFVVWVA